MKKSIREKDIALLWESRSLPVMEADSGVRVQVLYPGRDSVRKGCDFQDAILIIDDKKVHGDVEIHVSSDLWHSHGHHRDPSYNTIILHVAMWEGGGLPATTQSGAIIPTVILGRYLSRHTCNPVSRRKMRQTWHCSEPVLRGSSKKSIILNWNYAEEIQRRCCIAI
jgi:hypothetical protein